MKLHKSVHIFTCMGILFFAPIFLGTKAQAQVRRRAQVQVQPQPRPQSQTETQAHGQITAPGQPIDIHADNDGPVSCLEGSPTDLRFVKILRDSKDANILSFRQSQEPNLQYEYWKNRSVQTQMRDECILNSYENGENRPVNFCADENARLSLTATPGLQRGPCITQGVVDYIKYLSLQALECFSEPKDPLDPRLFLKKINNESRFHFFQADVGGVGLGQLTSQAVRQLANDDPDFLRRHILNTDKPSCQPFKGIISDDLDKKDARGNRYFKDTNSRCRWVSLERGLARNIIYSVGLFAYNREHLRNRRFGGNPNLSGDALNYVALGAYGPGGPRFGMQLAAQNPRSFQAVLDSAASLSGGRNYLGATQVSWYQLVAKIKKVDQRRPASIDPLGNSCVEPIPRPAPPVPVIVTENPSLSNLWGVFTFLRKHADPQPEDPQKKTLPMNYDHGDGLLYTPAR